MLNSVTMPRWMFYITLKSAETKGKKLDINLNCDNSQVGHNFAVIFKFLSQLSGIFARRVINFYIYIFTLRDILLDIFTLKSFYRTCLENICKVQPLLSDLFSDRVKYFHIVE